MATYFGATDNIRNSDVFTHIYSVKIDSVNQVIYEVNPISNTTCTMSDSLPLSAPANNNYESFASEAVAITGELAAYLDTIASTAVPGGTWEVTYTGLSTAQADSYAKSSGLSGPNPYAGTDEPIILVNFRNSLGDIVQSESKYFVLSNVSEPPIDAASLVDGAYVPGSDYNAFDLSTASTVQGTYYYSCFEKNTSIATPSGDVLVSELKIGDKVLTQDGRAVDVKWIGYQAINSFFAKKHDSMPVRIVAGALGDDLPKNALYVSPDHAFLMDGLLVNASALVNGSSITQMQTWVGNVEYYHIETEDHEIILAEGVPAETLLDNSGREKFANYKEFQELYPQGKLTKELDFPRVKFPRQLPEQIKKRLAAYQGDAEMAA